MEGTSSSVDAAIVLDASVGLATYEDVRKGDEDEDARAGEKAAAAAAAVVATQNFQYEC